MQNPKPVPIIGFGASAGGLEAFLKVLPGIPQKSGLAIILVQHLARNHPSLAADILQRATRIKIVEARSGLKIAANTIYIVPPNYLVAVARGKLHLTKRQPLPKASTAIDTLFNSLAKEEGSSAVAVLLSGTGRDGIAGLSTIRAHGGMTIAQSPRTAKFPTLPLAAIEQDQADFVLSPDKIGAKLSQLKGMNSWGANRPEQRILHLLRDKMNVDFTMYKEATLGRRIYRRMDFLKIKSIPAYEKYLVSHPSEVSTLFNDLLINVTSFFRETEFFKDLKNHVLPALLKSHPLHSSVPIRIWSAGCSTGEEVYSIAIACLEFMSKRKRHVDIRIFGTDLSEKSIRRARAGVYSEKAVSGVNSKYLEQYFEKTKGGYRISPQIREMCIFSKHDMTQDPPFAKLDLISCQNVLIYFKPALQRKMLFTFHYALNPHGHLAVGRSETLDDKGSLFRSSSFSSHIYKKISTKTQIQKLPNAKSKPREARITSIKESAALVAKASTSGRRVVRESVETVRDQLTAAIEELQSANEEFQSTNEELETTKEELQSSVEELQRTNQLVNEKNAELTTVSSDLRNILGAIQIPILLIGEDRRIRKFSPEAQREFHLSPTDAGGSIGILSSIFQIDMEANFTQVVETQKSFAIEVQVPHGGWRRIHLSPYRTNEGLADGAILTIDNIDDLKAREQISQDAFSHISSIIDAVPVALVVLEQAIELKSANANFFEFFKLDPTCVGETLFSALQMKSETIPKLQFAIQKAVLKGVPFHEVEIDGEFRLLGYRKFLVSGRRIEWRSSQSKEIVLSFTDITDRQRLETERSALLAQERLARKTAEQINQTKDVFLATLSHELRTPLASILAWAQLISLGKINLEKAQAGALIIEKSAKAQAQLIDDLLDISRIAAGKIHLNVRAVDPFEVLTAAVESVRPIAEKKNVQIQLQGDSESGQVIADPIRLQQVIWNLLTNAIKFSEPGQIVDLKLNYLSTTTGKLARIQVIDHGKGIPLEFMPHLFSRFSQADSATNRKFGGLGLGLFIVKSLVELQRGHIYAENLSDQSGAAFVLTLPRIEGLEETVVQQSIEKINPNSKPNENFISGLKLLLLDDDENAREAIAIFLSSFGAEVSSVKSTQEAFQVLELGQIDLIVSDIAMPMVDGYTFLSMVRSHPSERIKQLPAIALTANASADDSRKALAAGFQAHLCKPVDIAALVSLIAELHEKNSLA